MPKVVEFGGELSKRWNLLANRYAHANAEMLNAKKSWEQEQSKESFQRDRTKSSNFR
jgi:hypothetical protein